MGADELLGYLKSLNPKKDEQAILVYGSKYKLWRDGKCIGIATWNQDNNVGDSFYNLVEKEGIEIAEMYVADKWELIPKSEWRDLQWFLDRIGKVIYREESHIPGIELEVKTKQFAKICYDYEKRNIFKYRDIK